jgi:protein-S-isoprenylcysteine O-methyltransferase Ste14
MHMATLGQSAGRQARVRGGPLVALGVAYALVAFALALALFLYAIPFLANLKIAKQAVVTPSIDIGETGPVATAALVDSLLIALFGLQHSLMARPGFKRWLMRLVPGGLERATYVHASNLALWPVLLFWQPLPYVMVDLTSQRALISAIYWLGWLIVLLASLNIDLLELWGVRQAMSWARGETYVPPPFKENWLYRRVRHPIYLGLLIAFWATPQLSVGHALFAAGMTAYILIGTWFEERDLVRTYGDSYRAYRRAVPAYWPRLLKGARASPQR